MYPNSRSIREVSEFLDIQIKKYPVSKEHKSMQLLEFQNIPGQKDTWISNHFNSEILEFLNPSVRNISRHLDNQIYLSLKVFRNE